MSRDQLLGRARRAVLAVAGTAGALGGRTRRRQEDDENTGRQASDRQPAPTPGLPPRIDREPTPALPPRIEREPTPTLPPRIEREPTPALPPRIEREPEPAPRAPAPTWPAVAKPVAAAPEAPAAAPTRPEPEPEPEPAPPPAPPAIAEPVVAAVGSPAPARPEPEPESAPPPSPPAVAEPVAAAPESPAPAAPVEPDPAYQPQHARPSTPGPAPVRYSAASVRVPEPVRSPRRAGLRSHLWLTGIVLTVLAVGATGYWVLRVHQRIAETSLEQQLATRDKAPTVRCSPLQSDGAAWACAVVYRVESVCLIAKVNVLGSWSTAVGQHRCERQPELEALLPRTVTAAGVGADIGRQTRRPDFVCRKLPSHKVRWACGRPPVPGGECLIVRVVVWTSWNETEGGRVCDHFPALETALRRAVAAKA